MYIRVIYLLLFFLGQHAFTQSHSSSEISPKSKLKTTTIKELNEPQRVHLQHFADSNKTQTIETIQNQTFDTAEIERPRIGVTYWSTFFLNISKASQLRLLEFKFHMTDNITLYYPSKKGGYLQEQTGYAIAKKVTDMDELVQIKLTANSIDFTRPFFLKTKPMSVFGKNSIRKKRTLLYVTAHDFNIGNTPTKIKSNALKSSNFKYIFTLLIGMIIISFFYIFSHYLITKKVYFLFYALYLFFLIFNYGYRTFYFYNIYSEIHPHLYFYLNSNGQILANLSYMFFVKYFVDMKQNYPKFNKIYNTLLIAFCVFVILYNCIVIANPYYEHHRLLLETSIYVFSLLNFLVVCYLIFSKKIIHTTIVFIGSIMLLIGYVLAMLLGNFFILVPLIILESVLFMSVITYLDLQYFKKALVGDKIKQISDMRTKLYTNMSHEFRTPLTLIAGPLENQINNEHISKKDRDELVLAKRNSDRLLELVNQMLDLSVLDSGKLKLNVKQGNLYVFIEQLISSFKYKVQEKSLNIISNIDKTLSDVWFDAEAMEKIYSNLLSNAVKYTNIYDAIKISANLDNGNAVFTISNAITEAISAKDIDQLFERFYQANSNKEGIGVGLALVKELVNELKGTITAKKIKNRLVFEVVVPVAKPDNVISTKKAPKTTIESSLPEFNNVLSVENTDNDERQTLLIVEDHDDMRAFITSIFEQHYYIIEANNGKAGIEKALEFIPDIIISDIMMPITTGIELCNTLKYNEVTSHIPIMLLTAKSGDANEIKALKTGAEAYITKPFSVEKLKITVENLLENRKILKKHFSDALTINPDLANNSTENEFLKRLKNVIEQHITDPSFKTEQFYVAMHMSRMQLHRKLKSLTNMNSSEFLRTQRLNLALPLLKAQKHSISEIAYKTGFNSPSYFNKSFKKTYGCSPKEYLNNL